MNDITRHGPRFAIIIGFDLGKPRVDITKIITGHYALTLGYLEIHFMFGAGRDRTLDLLNAGIDAKLRGQK